MGYNKPEESDVRVYSVRPLPPASAPRGAAQSVKLGKKAPSEMVKTKEIKHYEQER